MICNLARITDELRRQVHADPRLVTQLLYPDVRADAVAKPSLLSRLLGRAHAANERVLAEISPIAERDQTDIDKSWHAIHFLLTGSDWDGDFPNGFLVSCGDPVGDVDVGYGPARSFSSGQVAKIADFLTAQSDADLRKRLDYAQMRELEIYPSIWDDEEAMVDEWEYILDGLQTTRDFLSEAKDRSLSLLVFLN